ncbi:MAG: formate dehydrogenase accessory sulfurtransferase FdhD, partial [Anaerolineae bacterium]|nr:formate dehydrogenase accessory sulfurtransferase FdhD [Anaerolineae bacterium]
MADAGARRVAYTGFYDDESRPVRGVVPAEAVVTLHVNGEPLVRLMCTPTDLEDLALGFLFNEGFVQSLDDVAVVELCSGGGGVDIWLTSDIESPALRSITSGCSGGTTFEDLRDVDHQVQSTLIVTPGQVTAVMEQLSDHAALYHRAGGVHAAALVAPAGDEPICVAEDVGRHNALDKIAGSCLRRGRSTKDGILLTSGRISSEMVSKVAHMGVPVVVSRTSPTTLSIDLAEAWGITLIGYTRRRS